MRIAPTAALARVCIALSWLFMATATSPALGQEAIPTAPETADGGAPPAPPTESPLRLSDHFDRGPEFLGPRGPCGGPAKTESGKTDTTPHGEVWAGAGTRGYRDAGGVVCLPLSAKTSITIAVDAGQIDGWRGRH
jgi:hypothetical protein